MKPAEYLLQLFGLEGKTAIVIGGTGVLGGAICDTLAAAGAHVLVIGMNVQNGGQRVAAIQTAGGSAEFIPADATSRADLHGIIEHLRTRDRQADVLVNGAGVNSATPFLEISDEEWDRIFRVNLTSVRLGCEIFAGYMLERKTNASIINVASLTSIKPLSRVFSYSASKAAVLNLTQNLAREWATQGIRVNAISPGFFPAEQNRKVLTAERVADIHKHTPMKRFGDPEELAGAVLLLASPVAGKFITGENVVVDGGFNAMTI